jgi:hypothetical protein
MMAGDLPRLQFSGKGSFMSVQSISEADTFCGQ